MGDSPRGRKESDATDVTEHAHMRTSGAKTPPCSPSHSACSQVLG